MSKQGKPTPHPTSNPVAFYGKLAMPAASETGVRLQLKNHRRKCRALSAALTDARADVEMLRDALKQIIDQSDVHGFWDQEHMIAEKALKTFDDSIKQRSEARLERLKKNGNIATEAKEKSE